MNRRDFLKLAGLGAASLTLPGCTLTHPARPDRPNILFIFADDHCHEALSAFGSQVRTPNLDRLVNRGVTFTSAFNQGAWHGAVCVASRTMLNTGCFLWHAKALEKTLDQEVEAGRFWSQYLARAGYDTYMTGKWHVKTDAKRLFHVTGNIRGGMPNQVKAGYNRPVEGEEDAWKPWDTKHGGYWKGGKHWSEVVGDDGEAFLKQAGTCEKPFFMYLAFNAPHDPRQSPKEYVDMYPAESVAVPADFLPEYPYKDAMGCSKKLRDEKLAPFPRTKHSIKVNRQEYFAIISHMDTQIGRILDALDRSGKADSTVIFFTADHGLAVGHHGLLGKQSMYGHSVRVPLIVAGPGIPADRRIDAPVYLQDVMPTSLELAGIEKPDHVQFQSLLPLIEGKREKSYDAIYGGYMNLQRMVRQGDHKLIHYPKIDRTLFFDLGEDPLEMNDLSGDPRSAARIEKLWEAFRKLQAEVGDSLVIE